MKITPSVSFLRVQVLLYIPAFTICVVAKPILLFTAYLTFSIYSDLRRGVGSVGMLRKVFVSCYSPQSAIKQAEALILTQRLINGFILSNTESMTVKSNINQIISLSVLGFVPTMFVTRNRPSRHCATEFLSKFL